MPTYTKVMIYQSFSWGILTVQSLATIPVRLHHVLEGLMTVCIHDGSPASAQFFTRF